MIIDASNKSYWTRSNYNKFNDSLNKNYLDEVKQSALELLSFLFEKGFEKNIILRYNALNYIECELNINNKIILIYIYENFIFKIDKLELSLEEILKYISNEIKGLNKNICQK